MKYNKRFVALFLAFSLIITQPISVFAIDEDSHQEHNHSTTTIDDEDSHQDHNHSVVAGDDLSIYTISDEKKFGSV